MSNGLVTQSDSDSVVGLKDSCTAADGAVPSLGMALNHIKSQSLNVLFHKLDYCVSVCVHYKKAQLIPL